jgi:radical SAM protein with 4Fe4S-binding SPASM domain
MKIIRFTTQILEEISEAIQRQIDFYRIKPKKGLWFLTYRCTSRCNTCTIWKRPIEKKNEISLEQWKATADKLIKKGMASVELFGGDVFLRKDILIPLIKYLKEKNMTIYMPTNCNLLDRNTAIELVKSGVDKLYLSTDGVDSDHDVIRGIPGTFSKVKNAVRYLLEARGNKKTPKIVCNTTVSNLNIDLLDNIADFAIKTGYDELHFEYVGEMTEAQLDKSIIDGLRPTPYYVKQESSVLLNKEQALLLKRKLKEIRAKYRNYLTIKTINIDMLKISDLVEGKIPSKKCYVERNEVAIDPNGNIVVCPFINNFILGNIFQSDIEFIWNNDLHKKFRSYQNKGSIEICKYCILSAQRNHSFLQRLQRIYKKNISGNYSRLKVKKNEKYVQQN